MFVRGSYLFDIPNPWQVSLCIKPIDYKEDNIIKDHVLVCLPGIVMGNFITAQKSTFTPKVVKVFARKTKVYKIGKFCKAVFFAFYDISGPNFAILLLLRCSFQLDFVFHV